MTSTPDSRLPVAIVGGGPVGLTAAAHLLARHATLYRARSRPRSRRGRPRMGPCRDVLAVALHVDRVARALLEVGRLAGAARRGVADRQRPGRPLRGAARPASRHRAARPRQRAGRRRSAARTSTRSARRDATQQPFEIHLESGEVVEARAVIDASGTWSRPNPAGSSGLAVPGEREHARSDRVRHSRCDRRGTRALRRQARRRGRQRPFRVQRRARSR